MSGPAQGPYLRPMGQNGRDPRATDQLALWTTALRKLGGLGLGDITRGLENFAHPSAAGLLESLGRTRDERVGNMAAMLRNSSDADIEEMGNIFGLAVARLADERAGAGAAPGPQPARPERPRRRRGQSAAEWRKERRLAS